MVKYTQKIRREFADELFECDRLVGLVLKGLTWIILKHIDPCEDKIS